MPERGVVVNVVIVNYHDMFIVIFNHDQSVYTHVCSAQSSYNYIVMNAFC